MARLIDAKELEKALESQNIRIAPDKGKMFSLIENAPTVDAVEVVRCKKCKHWLHMEDGMGDCTNRRFHLPGHADPTMKADDFCSCGERRTE